MSEFSIHISANPEEFADHAASTFLRAVEESVRLRGACHLALSGGSTPVSAYKVLTNPQNLVEASWSQVCFYWGDERFVPPSDLNSNEHSARQNLLSKLPISEDQIFPIYRPESALAAAKAYDEVIQSHVPEAKFDVIYLGIGSEGHTASLFPGDPAIAVRDRLVSVSSAPVGVQCRITLTLPAFRKARHIVFLAKGENKAEAVAKASSSDQDPLLCPAWAVAHAGPPVSWILDGAAARLLN